MSEVKLDVTVKFQKKNQEKGKHGVMEEEGSKFWHGKGEQAVAHP